MTTRKTLTSRSLTEPRGSDGHRSSGDDVAREPSTLRAEVEREVERHNALTYARAHLKTHIAWRDYLRAGHNLPHEKVGDLEHHEEAIRELNTICKVLRRV